MLMKTRGSLTFVDFHARLHRFLETSRGADLDSDRNARTIIFPTAPLIVSLFLREFSLRYISIVRELPPINLDGRWKIARVEEETARMLTERIQAKVFPARLVCKEKSINEPFRSFQGIWTSL